MDEPGFLPRDGADRASVIYHSDVFADGLDPLGQTLGIAHRAAWHARAACRGRSDVNFFPVRDESIRVARAFCAGCAVRPECLEYALSHDGTVGVWGGMTERERARLRRRRLAL